MSGPDLLCVGHVTLDRYGRRLLPGGCVTYAALTYAALGGRPALLSRAGKDFPEGFLTEQVAARILPSPATTIFLNHYRPDGRRQQELESLAGALTVDILPADWKKAGWLFLAPVMGELDAASWISACRAGRVAIGLQGFLRETRGRQVVPKMFDPRAAWLDAVDTVFISDDDCLAQPDLPQRLRPRVRRLVLTHQRRGCTVFRGPRELKLGIHPAREIDPTGAGDTFAAGFLHALSRGADDREAARLAAACASIVIEGPATSELYRLAHEARARAERITD